MTHPEHSLIALLLPGAVFCALTFMDWWETGRTPLIRAFGRKSPVWLTYIVIFVAGWLLLILMLAQSIQRRLKS